MRFLFPLALLALSACDDRKPEAVGNVGADASVSDGNLEAALKNEQEFNEKAKKTGIY